MLYYVFGVLAYWQSRYGTYNVMIIPKLKRVKVWHPFIIYAPWMVLRNYKFNGIVMRTELKWISIIRITKLYGRNFTAMIPDFYHYPFKYLSYLLYNIIFSGSGKLFKDSSPRFRGKPIYTGWYIRVIQKAIFPY